MYGICIWVWWLLCSIRSSPRNNVSIICWHWDIPPVTLAHTLTHTHTRSHIHTQFECEFRRFSVDRNHMNHFDAFYSLVKDSHHLPSEMPFTVSYTDPRNGDLLPITNNDNLMRAYTTAMPLLRLVIYRQQGELDRVLSPGVWDHGMGRGLVQKIYYNNILLATTTRQWKV